MSERSRVKDFVLLVALALATAGGFGAYYGYQAHAFLGKALYEDASGARFTRQQVLELVAQNGMQQILQNAAKEQQKKPDPVAAQPPEVK